MKDRYALIEDGKIVNIIAWNPDNDPGLYDNAVKLPDDKVDVEKTIPDNFIPEGTQACIMTPSIGDSYENGQFSTDRVSRYDDKITQVFWKSDGNLQIVSQPQ